MIKLINKAIEDLEFSRYGVMAFTITFGSCWGSVAIYFMSQANAPFWQLGLCGGISMFSNAMAIGLAPMRVLVWSFIAGVVVNAALMMLNM